MKKTLIILMLVCLSSPLEAYLENNFQDNGNSTITDSTTGLTWMKCSAGQSGSSCSSGSAQTKIWEDALVYCEDLDFAGHTDWRLPSINELLSIVDLSRYSPAINTTYFPNTQSSFYWSSTTYASGTDYAWGVHFYDGYFHRDNKTYDTYVRCVRS